MDRIIVMSIGLNYSLHYTTLSSLVGSSLVPGTEEKNRVPGRVEWDFQRKGLRFCMQKGTILR